MRSLVTTMCRCCRGFLRQQQAKKGDNDSHDSSRADKRDGLRAALACFEGVRKLPLGRDRRFDIGHGARRRVLALGVDDLCRLVKIALANLSAEASIDRAHRRDGGCCILKRGRRRLAARRGLQRLDGAGRRAQIRGDLRHPLTRILTGSDIRVLPCLHVLQRVGGIARRYFERAKGRAPFSDLRLCVKGVGRGDAECNPSKRAQRQSCRT